MTDMPGSEMVYTRVNIHSLFSFGFAYRRIPGWTAAAIDHNDSGAPPWLTC